MDALQNRRRIGRNGTDIDGLLAVQAAVRRLVAAQYSGWAPADREDLEAVVVAKYVTFFGRDHGLPMGDDGQPRPPIGWLKKVILRAGIDAFRKRDARPADQVDFGADDPALEGRLFRAVNGKKRISGHVADQVDVARALAALSQSYPVDAQLIHWHYVEDRDVAEVATMVGKTEAATRKAIYRAAVRLRELLDATPPTHGRRAAVRRVSRRS